MDFGQANRGFEMRAVGFGLKEHFEQAWGAQVENRVAVAGGEVTQGASDKTFAHPGDRSGARRDGGRSNREREQESKKWGRESFHG